MPEPSLLELTNIRVDPELGTGAPAVILQNSDLVRTLNDNAQFKAQNDWKKYTQFQTNLKEIYQDAGAIASIETMEQDKPELKKRMGEVFNKIDKDPHAFFSGNGAAYAQIQKELGAIRADATASKQNNLFDKAHREYMLRDPSLNTEENKRIVDNYTKQPLGKRQPYMLNLPGMFDPAALGKQLNESTKTVKPYTKYIDDGNYIESGTETTYDADKWNKLADVMYNMNDERGNMLRNTVQQRFQALPKEIQDQYSDQPDPAKAFYMATLEPFRQSTSITDKQPPRVNQFKLEQEKAKNKLEELKAKHKDDVSLQLLKNSGAKDVARLKEDLKGKTKGQQFGFLNRLVDNQIYSAIADKDSPWHTSQNRFKMKVSPPVLKTFGYTTGSGIMKETTDADEMYTDADGKNITVVFYKKDKSGNLVEDESKTKQFSKEEYKAIVGKELLGVSGSLKSVNTPDDEDDEDEDDDSGSGPAPVPPGKIEDLRKKYNY